MAGGRKRRVEEKETSGTRGKSPRGDEEEAGLSSTTTKSATGSVSSMTWTWARTDPRKGGGEGEEGRMVRGPRHASWQSMRNCMGGVRWLVDGYGCGGHTYGKGGGGKSVGLLTGAGSGR